MNTMTDEEDRVWKFKQCFGEHRSLNTIQEGDMLTTVEFSANGDYIATGDRAGRVVIFEQNYRKSDENGDIMEIEEDVSIDKLPLFSLARRDFKRKFSNRRSVTYKFEAEFQSHTKGFDCLKSFEIDEKINKIKFLKQSNDALYLLTTNDKTIKLWKISEQQSKLLCSRRHLSQGPNPGFAGMVPPLFGPQLPTRNRFMNITLSVPRIRKREHRVRAQEKKVFENAHAYHINGIGVNCDGMTFLSSDDLRLNLWDLNKPDDVYNIVDIKPENMENLAEVITCCASHPFENNMFVYSSSRGTLKLNDLRIHSNCDKNFKVFPEKADLYKNWALTNIEGLDPQTNTFFQQNSSFFSEVLASISDVSFIENGRHIISRDYLTVKIWDVNKESEPVEVINFLEHLKPRLKDLYANESIFDKFEVSANSTGSKIGTGTYNNCFYVFDKDTKTSTCIDVLDTEQSLNVVSYLGERKNVVENRQRMNIEPITPPIESPSTAIAPGQESQQTSESGQVEERFYEHREKALHLAMHPNMNCLAVAVENNLYIYGS